MPTVNELLAQNISNAQINVRTFGNILFNVKAFGAKGDGVTDDTADINSAIAAINDAGGGTLFLPKGVYEITSPLIECTVPVAIVGAGATATIVRTRVDGINVFTINAYFCHVNGLEIAYTGTTPTSGSGILLYDLDHATIEKCNIHHFYINIDTLNAAYWTIFNNLLYDPVKYNIRVQNTTAPDEGDSQIIGNKLFAAGNPNIDAHIYQASSGGLKVIGNKMLYGKVGIQSEIIDGVITSILLVSANSIEHQSENFIKLKRKNASGLIEYVGITGNEFRSDAISAGFLLDDGTDTVSITGNIMQGQSTAPAVQINNSAKDVTFSGNTLKKWDTGILLNFSNGNNARVTIGPNQYADDVTSIFRNIGYIQDTSIECDHNYTNNVIATDNVTYKNVFQIDLATFNGGVLELDIFGIVGNAGSFSRRITKLLNREGAGITVTPISDTAAGVAIDVNFDVTTVPGSVIVQVRKGGTTGTNLNGTCTIRVMGDVTGVKAFNTV